MEHTITNNAVAEFKIYLENNERCRATVIQYTRDVKAFSEWLNGRQVDKRSVMEYKRMLMCKYAPRSVNAKLASINSFFGFREWFDCRVKALKIQNAIFEAEERGLTKKEYEKLLTAAKYHHKQRLYMVLQTICSIGIRVSELKFITVEAVRKGVACINCKGKMRVVFLPDMLCKMLRIYIKKANIICGSIFITSNGRPVDRSNIWSEMKKLCEHSGVPKTKVFPHNLRHLFAKTFYVVYKDIVKLADILGHSNINTTRIYTMETGEVYRQKIQKLGLLLC